MATRINPVDQRVNRLRATRLFARFGIRRRAFFVPQTKRDIAAAGTVSESAVTIPKKAWIVGFGFQSAASDVVLATSDRIDLVTVKGTVLATFICGSDYTLGTLEGTTREAHPVGTFIATNHGMMIRINATNPGMRGSVYFFVDYEPSDEVGRA